MFFILFLCFRSKLTSKPVFNQNPEKLSLPRSDKAEVGKMNGQHRGVDVYRPLLMLKSKNIKTCKIVKKLDKGADLSWKDSNIVSSASVADGWQLDGWHSRQTAADGWQRSVTADRSKMLVFFFAADGWQADGWQGSESAADGWRQPCQPSFTADKDTMDSNKPINQRASAGSTIGGELDRFNKDPPWNKLESWFKIDHCGVPTLRKIRARSYKLQYRLESCKLE